MSTSSSDASTLSPRRLLAKLMVATFLVIASGHGLELMLKKGGLGDAFINSCANEGYEAAMREGSSIVVLGASDVVAIQPGVIGIPAATVTLRGATANTLFTGMRFVAQRETHLKHLLLVINPVSIATYIDTGIHHLSKQFGLEFDLWLLSENPIKNYKEVLGNLVKKDVWPSLFQSVKAMIKGIPLQRCDALRSRHGLQLSSENQTDPAQSVAKDVAAHARLVPDALVRRREVAEANIRTLTELVTAVEKQGVRVHVILPPLYKDYRRAFNTDELGQSIGASLCDNLVDLTSHFDHDTGHFRDATHVQWPNGSAALTADVMRTILNPSPRADSSGRCSFTN